jgi:hypothetical protein
LSCENGDTFGDDTTIDYNESVRALLANRSYKGGYRELEIILKFAVGIAEKKGNVSSHEEDSKREFFIHLLPEDFDFLLEKDI